MNDAHELAAALSRVGIRLKPLDEALTLAAGNPVPPELALLDHEAVHRALSAAVESGDLAAQRAVIADAEARNSHSAHLLRDIHASLRDRQVSRLVVGAAAQVDKALAKALTDTKAALLAAEDELYRHVGIRPRISDADGRVEVNPSGSPAKLKAVAVEAGPAAHQAFVTWFSAQSKWDALVGVGRRCRKSALLDADAAIVAAMRSPVRR